MASSLTLRLFQDVTEEEFRATAEAVAEQMGGSIAWDTPPTGNDEDLRTAASSTAVAVFVPHLEGAGLRLCEAIAKRLDLVWMELRIQEDALWDYSLFRGETHLHSFSTMPDYWGNDRELIRAQRGDIDELCRVWGCEKSRVEKYLQRWKCKWPWYSYALGWIQWVYTPPIVTSMDHWYWRVFHVQRVVPRGKAYEDDQCEYGDCWQMYDFLRALEIPDPMDTSKSGRQHRILLPQTKTRRRRP